MHDFCLITRLAHWLQIFPNSIDRAVYEILLQYYLSTKVLGTGAEGACVSGAVTYGAKLRVKPPEPTKWHWPSKRFTELTAKSMRARSGASIR